MKNLKRYLVLLVAFFMITPVMNVHAEGTITVTTEEELFDAVENSDATTIILGNDIDITKKLNVTRSLTIDGANHTLRYAGTFKDGSTNNQVWGSNNPAPYNGGVYVIHVYNTTATIKDITLTGGNAALNVNGSDVTLTGSIDVSGNGFGGIEVGKGQAVTNKPILNFENATLKNDTESATTPTLWVDKLSLDEVSVTFNGIEAGVSYNTQDKSQLLFYVDEQNVPEDNDEIQRFEIPTSENKEDEAGTEVVTPEQVEEQNPETSDPMLIFVLFGIIGLSISIVSFKSIRNRG